MEIVNKSATEILAGLCDSVRIIEVRSRNQYVLTPSGEIRRQKIYCHEFWSKPEPCKNCLAVRSKKTAGREEKVEVYNGRIYLVVGIPIAEGEYMVEIVKDLTDLISWKEEIMYHCEALREELEKLAQTAHTDPLTGVWNRRFIEEKFFNLLKKSENIEHRVAVLMADIDHFKVVNDTYGHTNGDEVLRRVAGVLQRSIRGQDVAIRYGGEEFCVVLYDIPEEVAIRVAERIRQQVATEEIILGETAVNVTISIGVAFYEPGMSAEDLLATADRRLYRAKNLGRNKVVWMDEQC